MKYIITRMLNIRYGWHFLSVPSFFGMSREVSMNTQDKQINSAVNSCRMALYNNNKAKSTNKTTRLINNLFKKYRKDDTENENEDENTKIDTLSIGLQLKEAVDAIFDPTTGMSEEEKRNLYRSCTVS